MASPVPGFSLQTTADVLANKANPYKFTLPSLESPSTSGPSEMVSPIRSNPMFTVRGLIGDTSQPDAGTRGPQDILPSKRDLGISFGDRLKGFFVDKQPVWGVDESGKAVQKGTTSSLAPGGMFALSAASTGLQTLGALRDMKFREHIESNKMLREYKDKEFMQRYQQSFNNMAATQDAINAIKALRAKMGGSYAGQQQQLS